MTKKRNPTEGSNKDRPSFFLSVFSQCTDLAEIGGEEVRTSAEVLQCARAAAEAEAEAATETPVDVDARCGHQS